MSVSVVVPGWADGYTNPVFRMLEKLPDARALVGPWSHEWPDEATPGPQIGYLQASAALTQAYGNGRGARKGG